MTEITRIGVDLAKSVIQIHAVDASSHLVTNRALKRDQFLPWCAKLPKGCLIRHGVLLRISPVGASSWPLGLMPVLLPPTWSRPTAFKVSPVKTMPTMPPPFAEAASRPHMRFVPVKSIEQQSVLRHSPLA